MGARCNRCGDPLDGAFAHALGWCSGCDIAPESQEVHPGFQRHGFLVSPACAHRTTVTRCRGALRWSLRVPSGRALCEAHWLVAEGLGYPDALAAIGRTCGEG